MQELDSGLEAEQKGGAEAPKGAHRYERKVEEMTYQVGNGSPASPGSDRTEAAGEGARGPGTDAVLAGRGGPQEHTQAPGPGGQAAGQSEGFQEAGGGGRE